MEPSPGKSHLFLMESSSSNTKNHSRTAQKQVIQCSAHHIYTDHQISIQHEPIPFTRTQSVAHHVGTVNTHPGASVPWECPTSCSQAVCPDFDQPQIPITPPARLLNHVFYGLKHHSSDPCLSNIATSVSTSPFPTLLSSTKASCAALIPSLHQSLLAVPFGAMTSALKCYFLKLCLCTAQQDPP